MAKLPFLNLKNYKKIWGDRINKIEQLYYWAQIQIPNDFELQIQEPNKI
jgi:hypothetical protein